MLFQKQPLEFTLPVGRRAGRQDRLEAVMDARNFTSGRYQLSLVQPNGKVHEVPVRVLPPNPTIDALGLRANLGEERQTTTLHGSGLDRIERIESAGAKIELAPARQGAGSRDAFVRLAKNVSKGDRLPLTLRVEGVSREIGVPAAMEVVGPRPRIAGVTSSLADELGIALKPGELPAGSFATFSLRIDNLESQPVLRVECARDERQDTGVSLRPGEKLAGARLDAAGLNLMFLSLDPGAIGPPGCTLTAAVSAEPVGTSDPYVLGRVIRLPKIDSFRLTDEKLGESTFAGTLVGYDLETIEKTGWDAQSGLPVNSLPKAIAGEGQKQSLRIALQWPSPSPRAPLFIWLRGEAEGRATKAAY